MIICAMCGRTIRNIPGKEGTVIERICPECQEGGVASAPSRLNPGKEVDAVPKPTPAPKLSVAPPRVTGVVGQQVAAAPQGQFVDLVVQAAADQVANKLMEIFRRGLETPVGCICGETKAEDTTDEPVE